MSKHKRREEVRFEDLPQMSDEQLKKACEKLRAELLDAAHFDSWSASPRPSKDTADDRDRGAR